MNAKRTDLSKIQEIYDVVLQTQRQMNALGFSKEQFLQPSNDQEDLIAEGVMNRVFRVTEEAGRLSMELAERYGFDTVAIRGVRNRLAHAYGRLIGRLSGRSLSASFRCCLIPAGDSARTRV